MKNNQNTYSAIILAAGASKRMEGISKQSLLVNGQSLLNRVIQTVKSTSVSQTCVVLGAQYQFHKNLIQHFNSIEIVENKQWENGIGSSIKAGMSWVKKNHLASTGVFILVCDQPFLSSNLLDEMIAKYESNECHVVACEYENSLGTPVFFDHNLFNDLQNINDQNGAKYLIEEHASSTCVLPFPEGAFDVDTRKDYEILKAKM